MRSKINRHIKITSAATLFYHTVVALVLSVGLGAISCSGERPLNGDESLPAVTAPKGVQHPNFVVFSDKEVKMSRPFLVPPGICGGIGRDGGVVCNGPVKLIIPENALSETTDICISAVNRFQLIAELTPAGQVFAADVTMEWNLVGSSAEGEAENVTTIWFNPATELWEDVDTEAPIDSNTTKTYIRHFSKYGQQVGG